MTKKRNSPHQTISYYKRVLLQDENRRRFRPLITHKRQFILGLRGMRNSYKIYSPTPPDDQPVAFCRLFDTKLFKFDGLICCVNSCSTLSKSKDVIGFWLQRDLVTTLLVSCKCGDMRPHTTSQMVRSCRGESNITNELMFISKSNYKIKYQLYGN